jgi:hypothetical protein
LMWSHEFRQRIRIPKRRVSGVGVWRLPTSQYTRTRPARCTCRQRLCTRPSLFAPKHVAGMSTRIRL